MARPRYKRANREPAPPLIIFHQPEPNSERVRLLEEAMRRSAERITQAAGREVHADEWTTNGRTL